MIIFTLILFTYNFVVAFGADLYTVLSAIPSYTKEQYFKELGPYILYALPVYIEMILHFLLLLYSMLFLVYYFEIKTENQVPTKKIKNITTEADVIEASSAVEEK